MRQLRVDAQVTLFFGWRGGKRGHKQDSYGPLHMGVSKTRDTPKWMVKIMENPIKMDDFGGKTHYFRKHLLVGIP